MRSSGIAASFAILRLWSTCDAFPPTVWLRCKPVRRNRALRARTDGEAIDLTRGRVVRSRRHKQCAFADAAARSSTPVGASNFFELAVAAAISLFGFESGAALATVVGVLIEVPVMLLVVKIVNGSKGWYEAGQTTH